MQEEYLIIGRLLSSVKDGAVILVDTLGRDCPVVGTSPGVERLTGFSAEDLLGFNCRVMLNGVPDYAISRSARKNLADYCRTCRSPDISHIAECTALQANARKDGSVFQNHLTLGRCVLRQRPYILGVLSAVGEGVASQPTPARLEEATETALAALVQVRGLLERETAEAVSASVRTGQLPAACGFFSERLQDHCILTNGGRTAMRREPQELPRNCLLFGDRPSALTREGLAFELRVDAVEGSFEGLPLLGFTRRRPQAGPGLFPTVSMCLGASVLVGAAGEAFARDQEEHFRVGFRPPPEQEVMSWSLEPGVPRHQRHAPVQLRPGDVIGCTYTWAGTLQFRLNGEAVLDFDVGRPIDAGAEYFAVVDVCFSAAALTLLSPVSVEESSATAPAPTAEWQRVQADSKADLSSEDGSTQSGCTVTRNASKGSLSSEEASMLGPSTPACADAAARSASPAGPDKAQGRPTAVTTGNLSWHGGALAVAVGLLLLGLVRATVPRPGGGV